MPMYPKGEVKQPIAVEQCMYCGEDIFWVASAKDPEIMLPLNVMPPTEERARELGVYTRDGRFCRRPNGQTEGWLYHPPLCSKRSRASARQRSVPSSDTAKAKTLEALLGPEPERGHTSPIADALKEIVGALEHLRSDLNRLLDQERSVHGVSRTTSNTPS